MRVFLCHASSDKEAVRTLYQRLSKEGFRPWLDEEDLLPGADWRAEIQKAVKRAEVVLVCLSPRSINKAGYVQKEISLTLDAADEKPEGTIFLIPVRLQECDVPERLTRWHWVDLFEPNGYQKLVRSLKKRRDELQLSKGLREPARLTERGHAKGRAREQAWRDRLARGVMGIVVPRPSSASFHKRRPISDLIRAQIKQFQAVEKELPPEWRTGIDASEIATEQEAANYIQQMTITLRLAGRRE